MSMAALERAVLAEARVVLNNPKLKKKDIVMWSSGPLKMKEGEVEVRLPSRGLNVAVETKFDKRPVAA